MNVARILPKATGTTLLAGALLFTSAAALTPTAAAAQVFLSVNIAPPAIPIYEQPLCPGDGYIWTPGYWAWNDEGYEWVEGAWVPAPYEGALWTPGFWAWGGGGYLWNAGYWGRTVGYYGGINYGFGYFGTGFYGGYWTGNRFFYNRAYNRVDERREHNFYERREQGFDGRPGGVSFTRDNDHGGFDRSRGSYAGIHDDHRENGNTFGNRDNRLPNGNSGDMRRDGNQNDQRGFAGNSNQRREAVQPAPATPNTNFRRNPNTTALQADPNRQGNGNQPTQMRQPFNNGQYPGGNQPTQNRQPYSGTQNPTGNQPTQMRQPFNGGSTPGGNQPQRPVYSGGGQSSPGGSINQTAPPQPQTQQQPRQSYAPSPQSGSPRSFSPAPAAPAQAPRQPSGNAPQGGGGNRGESRGNPR